MTITMIGHATVLVETEDVRVLMDPVLQDPHQEGMLEIFPPRTLQRDTLPEFDLLYLSHRHQDHFDIQTLSTLPRDIQVLLPDDPLLHHAFQSLGFENISAVSELLHFRIDNTEFLVTPSRVDFPEHGLVIKDSDGVFWNQVDTILDASAIHAVISRMGRPDLFLAAWQPMIEMAWQQSEGVGFPHDAYAGILDNIRRVRPKVLAPGANGFCYAGPASWLNQVVFPQSRERFLHDIGALLPECARFPFDPGDVLELTGGETHWHRRAASFVTSPERDPAVLEFCPPAAQRPLIDPLGDDGAAHEEAIAAFLENDVTAWLQQNEATFADSRTWEVIYQLEVRFGEYSRYWRIDFREPELRVQPGRTPLANVFCGITAAGLAGLIQGTASWDRASLGGGYYQYHRLYGVNEKGMVLPNRVYTPNPLSLLFPEDNAFEALVQSQLDRVSPR